MSEDVLDGFAATESATKMAQRAFNKGVQYFHDSNWVKAVECYNESLTYDDAFFSALCWRGCAYHHLGQFENVTSPSPPCLQPHGAHWRWTGHRGLLHDTEAEPRVR
jgi:hypothetical protein